MLADTLDRARRWEATRLHRRKIGPVDIGCSAMAMLCVLPTRAVAQSEIDAVVIHPPMAARFQCSEHPLGDVRHVADALGADCVVFRREGGPNGDLNVQFLGDGTRNEDWFSWREPVLAPFDGVVLVVDVLAECPSLELRERVEPLVDAQVELVVVRARRRVVERNPVPPGCGRGFQRGTSGLRPCPRGHGRRR